MLEQAFFKQKPVIDTEYRQLVIDQSDYHWQVRLMGGTKWWPDPKPAPLKVIPAKSFAEAKEEYNRAFLELLVEGWKAYTPNEPW